MKYGALAYRCISLTEQKENQNMIINQELLSILCYVLGEVIGITETEFDRLHIPYCEPFIFVLVHMDWF